MTLEGQLYSVFLLFIFYSLAPFALEGHSFINCKVIVLPLEMYVSICVSCMYPI